MSQFYPQIIQEVRNLTELIREGLGKDYDVYDEFADFALTDQLNKPTATVGIKSLESESRWFKDYAGIQNNVRVYGKFVTVTYEVTVHSPVVYGGEACRQFLCNLRDVLYQDNRWIVWQVKSGEIRYDRSRRCLYMPVDFVVKYII